MTSLSRTVLPWLLCLCCFFSVTQVVHAQTMRSDSDGDGLLDSWEVTVYQTNPERSDTDGDSFADRVEVQNGYNPHGAGTLPETDYDQDGLSDRLELLFGTDPLSGDTDGDGRLDGAEVIAAYSPTSTEPIPLQKSIYISLKRQTLEPRVANIAIAAYPVSSGLSRTPTPVGTFKILQKHPRAWSNSAKLWMPYWMHFSGRGHGLHELPEWPNGRKEGENHLGKPASHGCVRMGMGTAKKIYDWAPVGTPVIISRM